MSDQGKKGVLPLGSIEIKNYRVLKDVKIPRFNRINIIGGGNGKGKTTLLEAIFYAFDRRNPGAFQKINVFRQVAVSGFEIFNVLFLGLKKQQEITITAKINNLNTEIKIKRGSVEDNLAAPHNTAIKEFREDRYIGQEFHDNFKLAVSIDGELAESYLFRPDLNGYQTAPIQVSERPISSVTFFPASFIDNQSNVIFFDQILSRNLVDELIKNLKFIALDLSGIEFRHQGGQSQIYAKLKNGLSMPFAFLGNGAQTMVTIVMAIMFQRDGIVCLDEFESAIHHTNLAAAWKVIAEIANAYNCQLFVVTHSKECIEQSIKGIEKSGFRNNLQFTRLQEINGEIKAELYNYDEIESAIGIRSEVR